MFPDRPICSMMATDLKNPVSAREFYHAGGGFGQKAA